MDSDLAWVNGKSGRYDVMLVALSSAVRNREPFTILPFYGPTTPDQPHRSFGIAIYPVWVWQNQNDAATMPLVVKSSMIACPQLAISTQYRRLAKGQIDDVLAV